MNGKITKETEFQDIVDKADFETALMLFQDGIPEAVRNKFDIYQWVFIFNSPFLRNKTKELAWKNIKEAKLTFEQAMIVLEQYYPNVKIRAQMLDNLCLLAKNAKEINYCIDHLDFSDDRRSGILEKLSKVNDSFLVLAEIFLNSSKVDVQRVVLGRMQEVEATFEQWKDFNREFSHHRYLTERFIEMRKRADTFGKKQQVYNAFKDYPLLASEISALLQDLANTAENAEDLVWVYREVSSESIKGKILTAQGSFDNWLHINQSVAADEEWLKELSLNRMRESAKSFYQWSVVWCRESIQEKKDKAVSNMIEMASDIGEAKLAFHRAVGTALVRKAQQKLKEIVLALS